MARAKSPASSSQSSATIAFSGQLFSNTQIPVCLWFLAKNKNADAKCDFRDHLQLIESAI